jgi:hypothetical protein
MERAAARRPASARACRLTRRFVTSLSPAQFVGIGMPVGGPAPPTGRMAPPLIASPTFWLSARCGSAASRPRLPESFLNGAPHPLITQHSILCFEKRKRAKWVRRGGGGNEAARQSRGSASPRRRWQREILVSFYIRRVAPRGCSRIYNSRVPQRSLSSGWTAAYVRAKREQTKGRRRNHGHGSLVVWRAVQVAPVRSIAPVRGQNYNSAIWRSTLNHLYCSIQNCVFGPPTAVPIHVKRGFKRTAYRQSFSFRK